MSVDFWRPGWRPALALALLVAAAVAVRLGGITQPVVNFHPTRHYRSAVIARAMYYDRAPGIPAWARRVADANRAMQPAGEPQVMEWLACLSYLGLGHENIAIPRVFAVIAWVAGAIPLYLLALRLGAPNIALLAVTFYLFLPYGIVASRNFQPDALMTLCTITALLALVRHYEQPRTSRLAVAALAVAVATLVKPMSVFLTLPVLAALGLTREDAPLAVRFRDTALLFVLSLAPAGLFYGYGAIFGTLAKDQMRMRFVPALLTSAFFWRGWLTMIGRVFTLPFFAIAVLGALVAPVRLGRVMLTALWLGYVAFAVAFTYHMPTHDYYHWPFIAVVALGTAAVAARLQTFLPARPPVSATLTALACLAVVVLGTRQALPRLTVPNAAATLAQYREIGELTEHDPRVLFLDLAYGYPLMYHGELSGDSWPNKDDLNAEVIGGEAPMDARTRYARDYADFGPDYFVVTDLGSLAAQPDLQALLAQHATVVKQTPAFHVYKFVN